MRFLITADGRYNMRAVMTHAHSVYAFIDGTAMHEWVYALRTAWNRAHAEMTGFNVEHRRRLTEVPAWEARELATDGRL
jgi:hypothetical protein